MQQAEFGLAPARRRDPGPSASQGGGLRRLPVRRPQDGALYRRPPSPSEFAEPQVLFLATTSWCPCAMARRAHWPTCARRSGSPRPLPLRSGVGAPRRRSTRSSTTDEPVLLGLDTDIVEIEDQVFSEDRRSTRPNGSYKLKREVLDFLRHTRPLAESIDQLVHERTPHGHPELHQVTSSATSPIDLPCRRPDRGVQRRPLRRAERQPGAGQRPDRTTTSPRISAWVAIGAVPT